MAVDKLVDSSQLDASLTSVANAIRAKTGESSTMTLDQMPSKISGIQTGIEPIETTWNTVNSDIQEYLSWVSAHPYSASDYTTSYFDDWTPMYNDFPIGIAINLPSGDLSVVDSYNNHAYKETISAGSKTIYNLIPYSTNFNVENNDEIVATGNLLPTGSRRFIRNQSLDGNMRDLGGLTCDGGTVKYGKIIRGGGIRFNSTSERDEIIRILHDEIGIRAELELRGSDPSAYSNTLIGSDVDYCKPYVDSDYWCYYSTVLSHKEELKEAFRFIFDSVKNGRTLYFHCQQGADRTGTMAVLIEALLGVQQNICDVDYELTSFHSASCFRKRNGTEGASPEQGAGYRNFINALNNLTTGNTLRDKVVNLIASLGFTSQEINDFRASMSSGTPEIVTPVISTYSVTKTATNTTITGETTATQYQCYESEITPSSGYKLSTVNLTMGGVDVKASCYKQFSYPYNLGKVSISNVVGNIVINATAEQDIPSYTNLADPTSSDWLTNYKLNSGGSPTSASGKTCSNFISCTNGDVIYIKGVSSFSASSSDRIRIGFTKDGTSGGHVQYTSVWVTYDSSNAYGWLEPLSTGYYAFHCTGTNMTINNLRCSFSTPEEISTIIITKNEPIS